MKILPSTKAELNKLGWDQLDIILVSGDAYIDSPFMGVSMIGRVLADAGYKVGIIGQPDVETGQDITRLGEPKLFWGISGGAVDSMVANFTASKKRRRNDDYTPGGKNDSRPDRAVIVYSNLIRKHFKQTVPIVLGGIEASLRRIAHYDFWTDKIRKSILFDAKADYLVFGMGEKSALGLADCLRDKTDPKNIRGLCYISNEVPEDYITIPSYKDAASSHDDFTKMFELFYQNSDPITGRGIAQKQDSRYLIANRPAKSLTQAEMDQIYDLGFSRDVHPFYAAQGDIKATETIGFSLSTHRGCYGECNFCAITVHEGRTIQSRSEKSILEEADRLTKKDDFKGYFSDVGGPTANMYGFECDKKLKLGSCPKKRCVYPKVCKTLKPDHSPQINLLEKVRNLPGVKKAFVASGIRYDMLQDDKKYGYKYLENLVNNHVSGQLRVAPEHTDPAVLELMGKPPVESLNRFREDFEKLTKEAGKKQYLTYYFIAAHPGCTEPKMKKLKTFTTKELKITPEQVQIYTPLPSTWSAVMYYTGKDPFTGRSLFVEKGLKARNSQKYIITDPYEKTSITAQRSAGAKPNTRRSRR